MVASKIGMRAYLCDHALLPAQSASFKSVFGLDRSSRRFTASNIGR